MAGREKVRNKEKAADASAPTAKLTIIFYVRAHN